MKLSDIIAEFVDEYKLPFVVGINPNDDPVLEPLTSSHYYPCTRGIIYDNQVAWHYDMPMEHTDDECHLIELNPIDPKFFEQLVDLMSKTCTNKEEQKLYAPVTQWLSRVL